MSPAEIITAAGPTPDGGSAAYPRTSNRLFWSCSALLFLSAYLIHFTRMHEFGLWEDDYWSIAPNLGQPISGLWDILISHFRTWPTGRPLNHFLPTALARIGWQAGGLEAVYAIAMVWLGVNATLAFAILRRLVSLPAAFVGALAYLLYPADTTRVLLVHAAHLQGAMTFLLGGTLLWLNGGRGRWFGYPVAGLALLSYETAFLPFLFVPLLVASPKRQAIRDWTLHLVVCGLIMGIIAGIRLQTGDARAIGAIGSAGETAMRMATSLYLGPLTNLRAVWHGTSTGWANFGLDALLAAAVLIILSVGLLLPHGPKAQPPSAAASGTSQPRNWRLLAVGTVMLSGSYVLTIVNYPPTQLVGRFTSTHLAAAWPFALLLAVGATFIASWRPLQRAALIVGLAVATLLTSYHHHLQAEYLRSWRSQQAFWREVLDAAPDAGAGWTVIVIGQTFPRSSVIAANSWADYHVFKQLFDDPSGNGKTEFAHLTYLANVIKFKHENGAIWWTPQFWNQRFVALEPSRLVLLESDGASVRRIASIDTPAGRLEGVLPLSPERTVWPSTPLARIFFPERNP